MNEPADQPQPETPRVRRVASLEVPVYNCQVYVTRSVDGAVARVANLPDLSITADSERQALQQLVTAFKQRIQACQADGRPVPWLDPPSPPEAGEQTRWIAVHL